MNKTAFDELVTVKRDKKGVYLERDGTTKHYFPGEGHDYLTPAQAIALGHMLIAQGELAFEDAKP